MTTLARYCLTLGTLVLALMVTLSWAGPRAQLSTKRTIDVTRTSDVTRPIDASDPIVQLALGVLQADIPETGMPLAAQPEPEPIVDVPVMPAVSDLRMPEAVPELMMPDETVRVVAPAKLVVTGPICEDV